MSTHLCKTCVNFLCACPKRPENGTIVETCKHYDPTPMKEEKDIRRQVGGNHYNAFKIQPWDIIDEHKLDYYEGNVLKYLLRRKDPTKRREDLEKAKHYLEKCLSNLK